MNGETWAVGGGKGGTGKTFITGSLGINLAQNNKKVILIDADLGGANLHSFIRVQKPEKTLSDFFNGGLSLEEIMQDTQVPGLKLITGDIHSCNPMSIKYVQKVRFFRQVKHLEADYILLDLGGGSNLNTIDTFLLADKMIVAIVPEITAIENLYHFLKKALFRKMNIILRKYRLDETILLSWEKQNPDDIKSIGEMIRCLRSISVEISLVIDQELADFKIYLILNQARNREHIEMGFSVRSVIIKYFGVAARYIGYIEYSDLFWKAIDTTIPLVQSGLSSAHNREIAAITENLVENKQITLTGINHA